MIKIPTIANDEQDNFNELGNEFFKIVVGDRDRNLIVPTKVNPPVNTNQKESEYYYDGIAGQGLLFQNNYDLKENQLLTVDQQQKILDELSINRPYTSDEILNRELQNFDLDPNIRNLLVQESTRSKDNIYAQESQDFVKEVQKDLAAYQKEKDLYKMGIDPVTRLTSKLEKQEMEKLSAERKKPKVAASILNNLANYLVKTKRIQLRDALAEAARILESPEKEAEEKLAKKRAVEEAITRERAGVKEFKPIQEERLINVKDEL